METPPKPDTSLCSRVLATVDNYCQLVSEFLGEDPSQIELFLLEITPSLSSSLNKLGKSDHRELWQIFLTCAQLVGANGQIEFILADPIAPLRNPAILDSNFVNQLKRSALRFSSSISLHRCSR